MSDDERTLHMTTVHAHFDDRLGGMWEPWTDDQRNVIGWRWTTPDAIGHQYLYLVFGDDFRFRLHMGATGNPNVDPEIKVIEP